jgi:mono/diheme cytochrome c family protein
LLDDANGWTRDQAQRQIVESGKTAEFAPRLREMYRKATTERQRIYALWSLEGIGAFSADDLALTQKDASAQVRVAGIRAAEPMLRTPQGAAALQALVAKIPTEDPLVLSQLALSLDGLTTDVARAAIWQMLPRAAEHPSLLDAVLLVCRDRQTELVDKFTAAARGASVPVFGGKVVASTLATRIALSTDAAAQERLGAAVVDPSVPEWCRIALMQGIVQPNLRGGRPGTRITMASAQLTKIASAAPDALVRRFAGQAAEQAKIAESRRQRGDAAPMNAAEQRLYAQGQATFLVCAACHQPDGLGKEAIAPSLKDGRWATAMTPDAAIRIVLHGKQGTPGFPAAMVPLASLNDEQIAGVLTYVRRSFGNQASTVNAADVSRVRGETASRTAAWNDADLEKATAR